MSCLKSCCFSGSRNAFLAGFSTVWLLIVYFPNNNLHPVWSSGRGLEEKSRAIWHERLLRV